MWRQVTPYDLGTFTANGQSAMRKTWPFRNANITLIASSSFDGDITFYASNAPINANLTPDGAPDLSVAASGTNEYSVTAFVSKQTWDVVSWPTWVAFTWAEDWVTRYMLNDNNNNWVWVQVTNYVAWTLVVRLDLTDNQ